MCPGCIPRHMTFNIMCKLPHLKHITTTNTPLSGFEYILTSLTCYSSYTLTRAYIMPFHDISHDQRGHEKAFNDHLQREMRISPANGPETFPKTGRTDLPDS